MNAELYDLLTSDIYTDAPEYRERVDRIRKLLQTPAELLPPSFWIGTHTYTTGAELYAFDHEPKNHELIAAIRAKHPHETIAASDILSIAFVPLPAPKPEKPKRQPRRKVKHLEGIRSDGDPTNEHRASWAGAALELFRQSCGVDAEEFDADAETYVSDLLADLMHWCNLNGASFDVGRATDHYEAELLEEAESRKERAAKRATAIKTGKLPLKTETNTATVDRRIRKAFRASGLLPRGKRFSTAFEHGQWWISILGADEDQPENYSVHDAVPGIDGFGFEQV